MEAKAELGALEAMAVQGAQEAMAGGPCGRGLVPRPGHSSRNPSTPPKKFPGEVRGYQEPSGARRTGQDRNRTAHRAKQTGTGQGQDNPQEQEALLG